MSELNPHAKWLRSLADTAPTATVANTCRQAADEIERLQELVGLHGQNIALLNKIIVDARAELTAARAELAAAHERESEMVSEALDPSTIADDGTGGVSWMRCSPSLPAYVQNLERNLEVAEQNCKNLREALAARAEAREEALDAARYRLIRDEDAPLEQIHKALLVIPHGKELDEKCDALLAARHVERGEKS